MKTIKLGSSGEEVLILQKKLKDHGYLIAETGIFDETVRKIVLSFQRVRNLAMDGIVGSKTWEELDKIGRLTENDFIRCSNSIGTDIATIKAVCEVESGGYGFISPGKPKILFEGHIFWKELKKAGLKPENYVQGNEDILYKVWDKTKYCGGSREYNKLERAIVIDRCCALKSASWGLFQIMGFNYLMCGCETIDDFVGKMKRSEGSQLDLFIEFIKRNALGGYLRDLDWAGFAKAYNGPGYRENKYDEKLESAYNKYK